MYFEEGEQWMGIGGQNEEGNKHETVKISLGRSSC